MQLTTTRLSPILNTFDLIGTGKSEFTESPIAKWCESSVNSLPKNRDFRTLANKEPAFLKTRADAGTMELLFGETDDDIILYDMVDEMDSLTSIYYKYIEEIKKFYQWNAYFEIDQDSLALCPCAELISEIDEIANECAVSDWDGYDAEPIHSDTIIKARGFIYSIPQNLPLPEVAPESDGEISFDWIWAKNRALSLSINKNGAIAYAWIDGEERGHAVAKCDEKGISSRIINSIKAFL